VCIATETVSPKFPAADAVGVGGGTGTDVGAVFNGAGGTYNRDVRNTDTAAAVAAAAAGVGASSSELSESDNETAAGFSRASATDYNRPATAAAGNSSNYRS